MTDQELLSEYADGRLDGPARGAFERRLAAEPELASRLRLLRAMRDALRAEAKPAPAALRARLRAAARAAAPAPSWTELLREALSPRPWSLAAAGACAAALLMVAVDGSRPPAPAAPAQSAGAPLPETRWVEGPAQRALAAELWSDDEGGDDDAL